MLFSGTAIAYYVGIMSCAAFLCFLGINRVISKSIHDCFVMAVVCILILDVAEMGDIFLSEYPEPSSLRYIFSATGYSVRPMIVFAITCITLRGSRTKLVQMNILLIIVNAVLAFSSILWGTVFSFDEANHFVRGSLGALPFIVSSIMLFEFLVLGISKGASCII